MGKLNLRLQCSPAENSILGEKIEDDRAEQSEASVAEKRAAERSKVKAKTWCRATEGEAVRHSYWSVIKAVRVRPIKSPVSRENTNQASA